MRERVADGSAQEVAVEAADAPATQRLGPTAGLTPQALLGLQRSAGNRAAAALVARQPVATATLKWGSKGNAVLILQSRLNQLAKVKTALLMDGIYGPITTSAVSEFQTATPPLTATGAVDAETQAAIEAALAEEQDAVPVARKMFALGARAYEESRFGHAYAFFTRAYELAPRDSLLFSRAQALRRAGGRREEAIALYEAYIASKDSKRREEAEEQLAELKGPTATGDEKTDTDAARGSFQKGAAAYEEGRFADAYDEFTKAYELAPRDSLLFSRAQALRRLGGRRDEAIALYEAYIASKDSKRRKDAEEHLAELKGPAATGDETADTDAARTVFKQGAALYDEGDFAHAYDKFTKSGELAPRSQLLYSRAQALRRLGGHEAEAIALYEQYIEAGDGSRLEDAAVFLELLRTHGAAP